MPDWNLVDRAHVLATLEEYDRLGDKEFLRRYGFGRARVHTLWHAGREYDAGAVLGVGLLRATGRPVLAAELRSHEDTAAKVLTDLGFDVVAEEQPVKPVRPKRAARTAAPASPRRTAAPAAARKKAADPAQVRLCPSCHVAVPASGVCDFCD